MPRFLDFTILQNLAAVRLLLHNRFTYQRCLYGAFLRYSLPRTFMSHCAPTNRSR